MARHTLHYELKISHGSLRRTCRDSGIESILLHGLMEHDVATENQRSDNRARYRDSDRKAYGGPIG